ncbi:hypothetical protein BDV18DRAFT_106062 [Aspergillus unguis]
MSDSPAPEHIAFTEWAQSNGIEINGVAPAHFPGRRLGMIATRNIEENEVLLSIPVSLMLTSDSVPESFVSRFPEGTSNHALLAAYLTHGDSTSGPLSGIDTWKAVWPSWEEFEQSMPLFWTGKLRASNLDSLTEGSTGATGWNEDGIVSEPGMSLLPPSISNHWASQQINTGNTKATSAYSYDTRYQNLLAQQYKRLRDHWTSVVSVFPSTVWTDFARNWAVVNSRSFYYVSPEKEEPEDWNDAIALVPYADYFNHVDDADCEVHFDGKEYTFKASRQYEKGEEIYMSYGSHSNDFLLVEYGFYLEDNPSDAVYLDGIILADLDAGQTKDLAEYDYFGNFELTSSGVGDSTIAAASIKYMSDPDWRNYVTGVSERGFDKNKTADIIRGWIGIYLEECSIKTESLIRLSETISAESEREKLDSMLDRWRQIRCLCQSAMSAISEQTTNT